MVVDPFVVGDLVCEVLRSRTEVPTLLKHLPRAPVVTSAEVLVLIVQRRRIG